MKDEMVDSVVAYVEQHIANQLPHALPILSVCAKGDTSGYVAQRLRRLGYASANLKGRMKAWGLHYATRAVVETATLAVYQVSRPARGCLSYVVASAGKAVVIDPVRHLHFASLAEADDKGIFAASLDDQKQANDGLLVLQGENEDGFVHYLLGSLPRFIPDYVDIKRGNAGLLAADEDAASTLETGKNVCALSQAYKDPSGETT